MKIINKRGQTLRVVTPTIEGNIINIEGYCEYYIESLIKWFEKGSDVLCIDAGANEYVLTSELKEALGLM